MTQEGLDKLRKDLADALAQRPVISAAIAEAREKGDLSENAEYDAARDAQGLLEVKIAKLKELVANAKVIDESMVGTDTVQMTNKVKIQNMANNQVMEFTIVGETEADLLVGVADSHVLADEGNAACALRLRRLADKRVPDRVPYGPDVKVQLAQDLLIEPLPAQFARHGIDAVRDVPLLDDTLPPHVAEHGKLLLVLLRYLHLRAADEDVGNDADVAELSYGVLRRFGLELACRLQVGNERQVHEAGVLDAFLEAELPRGLEEGERLDVAGDAADLAEDDVAVVLAGAPDRRLDLVRDVRHDLDRSAEIAARAFAREDGGVYASRGEVGGFRARDARKALVVSEIEVGFRAVVRHEHLAVLVGRHRAWIDVQIGI